MTGVGPPWTNLEVSADGETAISRSDAGPSHPSTVAEWGLDETTEYIADVQRVDGLIPWYFDGPADPWDHVESAMGLSVAGRYDAAADAYRWLDTHQLDDGSWWAAYGDDDGDVDDGDGESRRETHRVAYVAAGVWHHYLTTGDRAFLDELWPTVVAALDFVLDQQSPTGEVYWMIDADDVVDEDALVTGCSSIHKSLGCGVAMARLLDAPDVCERWAAGRARLGEALRERPERFDRTWKSKDNYAMDWFYPVLCGVVRGSAARDRLDGWMDRFVESGLGCRCVADEPWVTVAETCELVMALAACGRHERAARIFEWCSRFEADDGGYWTGYQFEDDTVWPEERPTWTAGAVLLAADALGGISPAADFFTGGADG